MVLHEERILISVIIPVYNAAPHLRRCIDSLLKQTFRNFEIILVDDGSTDGSFDICEDYFLKFSRVRVEHLPNSGVSSARNYGIETARGEYICFVDADDWVEPDFLQNFNGEVEKRKTENKVLDCVMQGYVGYKGQSFQTPYIFYDSPDKIDADLFRFEENKLIGYVWNKIFRREVIVKHHLRFNPDISIGEDFLFCMEAINFCQRMTVLPDVGYHYVFTGEKSYSFTAFDKRLSAFDNLLNETLSLPTQVVNKFQFQEFIFSLYVFHVLYRENQTRKNRIKFLRKTRNKAHNNPEIDIYKLSYPYIILAVIVLFLPLTVADYILKMIYK